MGSILLAVACGAGGPPAAATAPATVVVARPTAPPPGPPSSEAAPSSAPTTIEWMTDEPSARARAARDDVPIVVFVCADWSAASVTVERTVFADPDVVRMSRDFVMLRLDVTAAEGDAELYAERYDVRQLPAFVVLDPDGRTLHHAEGNLEAAAVAHALEESAER